MFGELEAHDKAAELSCAGRVRWALALGGVVRGPMTEDVVISSSSSGSSIMAVSGVRLTSQCQIRLSPRLHSYYPQIRPEGPTWAWPAIIHHLLRN